MSLRRGTKRLAVVFGVAGIFAGAVAAYSAAAAAPSVHLPIAPVKKCGDPVVFQQPSSTAAVLAKLPKKIRTWYQPYYSAVTASPWSNWKGKKGPWKIGVINFPVDNPWQVGVMGELNKEFAIAKKKGLVKGSLDVYVQPDFATATPDQQIAALQQMVRSGVDLVILHPLDTFAETAAIDAAGSAGVPVIQMANVDANSKYSINDISVNQPVGISEWLKMYSNMGWFKGNKTYNTFEMRGVQGNDYETTVHDSWVAATAPCKGINVVNTLWGNWSPTTSKTVTLSFLSSYPGTIDFIEHGGAMQSGIIEAYETVGKTVPPMQMGGTTGGDLNWWCSHPSYKSIGYEFSGKQVGYTLFDVATRMLAGKGIKLRDLSFPAVKITAANVCKYAPPGGKSVGVTYVGDVNVPENSWVGGKETNLDYFFKKPGSPMGDK
jgi:ABC-type sugar transport system substrate-binding protein